MVTLYRGVDNITMVTSDHDNITMVTYDHDNIVMVTSDHDISMVAYHNDGTVIFTLFYTAT